MCYNWFCTYAVRKEKNAFNFTGKKIATLFLESWHLMHIDQNQMTRKDPVYKFLRSIFLLTTVIYIYKVIRLKAPELLTDLLTKWFIVNIFAYDYCHWALIFLILNVVLVIEVCILHFRNFTMPILNRLYMLMWENSFKPFLINVYTALKSSGWGKRTINIVKIRNLKGVQGYGYV